MSPCLWVVFGNADHLRCGVRFERMDGGEQNAGTELDANKIVGGDRLSSIWKLQ